MPVPFVESPNVTPTDGRVIDVVVIHTMEIAEHGGAAETCARWFASPASQVSAHYCVDASEVIQCVREQDIAWHARSLFRFVDTKQANIRVFLQIWDSHTGSVAWEGGGEVNYAFESVTERPVTFQQVAATVADKIYAGLPRSEAVP